MLSADGARALLTLGARVGEWCAQDTSCVPVKPAILPRVPDPDVAKDVVVVLTRAQEGKRSSLFTSLDSRFVVPGFAPMHMDSGNIDTNVEGVRKRFGRITPDPKHLEGLAAFVDECCLKWWKPLDQIRDFDCKECVPQWPLVKGGLFVPGCGECYCCTSNLPQSRLDEYRKCHLDNHGTSPSQRRIRKVKSFGKSESYVPKLKHLRWINSRSDHFKAYAGPAFKEIEHVVYQSPYFIKHVPVDKRASLIESFERIGREYFISDYEAFESHMKTAIMQAIESRVYKYFLQKFPELARVVVGAVEGTNICCNPLGVKVSLKARRMSGDLCTSLGNGLTNLFVGLYIVHVLHGVPLDQFDFLVEGDDGLLAVPAGTGITAGDYKDMGFNVKLCKVPNPGQGDGAIAFCGLNIAGGQLYRDLLPFISKFAWALNSSTASRARMAGLLKAKAMSTLCETPQCPIIAVIARTALEAHKNAEAIFIKDGYHEAPESFNPGDFAPTAALRDAFSRLTGILPEQQLALEQRIRTEGNLQCLNHLVPNECQQRYWSGWIAGG